MGVTCAMPAVEEAEIEQIQPLQQFFLYNPAIVHFRDEGIHIPSVS